MSRFMTAALLVTLSVPAAVSAQQSPGARSFGGGAGAIYGAPQGEFSNYVDNAWGLGGFLAWTPQSAPAFALRLDGGFMNYGHETYRVPLSGTIGGRITVDVTTDNNIAYLGIGPQLMLPYGPIRPYANAAVGLSYFATTSHVKGDDSGENFASDTNFDDTVFQWSAGGGIMIPVSRGRTPISIDLGTRYHGNGEVMYVTEGGIEDNPDGSITIHAIESEARVLSVHLGIAVGFGGAR